jgi:hypothetical protein
MMNLFKIITIVEYQIHVKRYENYIGISTLLLRQRYLLDRKSRFRVVWVYGLLFSISFIESALRLSIRFVVG